MRTITRKAVVAALLGLALAVGLPSAAAAQTTTISSGHVDVFAFAYNATAQTLDIKVDDHTVTPAQPRDPATVVFDVHSGHKHTLNGAVDCVGAAGQQVWTLPRLQQSGKIWAGWNTDAVALGDFAGNRLRLELVSAVTPSGGQVSVYDPGSTSGTVNVRFSSNGACDPGGTNITESHHHPQWTFTAAGTYQLTFKATGQHNSHGAVSSDNITFTFVVS